MKRLLVLIFLTFVVMASATNVKLAANDAAKNNSEFQSSMQMMYITVTVTGPGVATANATSIPPTVVPVQVNVERGSNVNLMFSPNGGTNGCNRVKNVRIDNNDVGAVNTYTIVSVNDNSHIVEVEFEAQSFTIGTDVGPNGTINIIQPSSGATTILCNQPLVFELRPNANYVVDNCEIKVKGTIPSGVVANGNTYTVPSTQINGDVFIRARFKVGSSNITRYNITTSVVGGTITPSQQVDSGSNVTIIYAPADPCKKLDSVIVNGNNLNPPPPSPYPMIDVRQNMSIRVVYKDTCGGIKDTYLTDFVIYPNPTDGKLLFKSSADITKIEVLNLNGVVELVIENPDSNLNLSNLGNGVYFLRVYSAAGVEYRNVILNK